MNNSFLYRESTKKRYYCDVLVRTPSQDEDEIRIDEIEFITNFTWLDTIYVARWLSRYLYHMDREHSGALRCLLEYPYGTKRLRSTLCRFP